MTAWSHANRVRENKVERVPIIKVGGYESMDDFLQVRIEPRTAVND